MSDTATPAIPPPNPLRAYAAVTAAYWAFMLSDGALRMLVLLHFNSLGFTPVQLAWLFLLYEIAGIVTNLAAGWLAARFGLAATLYAAADRVEECGEGPRLLSRCGAAGSCRF